MLKKNILYGLRSYLCRGKTSEKSQASSHTFLYLRHNSEHVDHVISGTGRPQENRILRSLKTHKKIGPQCVLVWDFSQIDVDG